MTILNHRPAVRGHLLVLPREHVPDVWDCPDRLYQSVYAAVRAAALLLRDRLGVDGVTIVEAVRSAGWQSIPHLHAHVLPRHDGDGLAPIWDTRVMAGEDALAEDRRLLRTDSKS